MKHLYYLLVLILCCISCDRQATTAQSLISQLHGNDCTYDAECLPHWSWGQRTSIRNPEYYCRMRAAKCMARLGVEAKPFINELDKAISELKYEFDTGDGIIYYGKCLTAVISAINLAPNAPDRFELMACGY